MMCQRCGQRAATTHIKTVVNGQLSESHLCSVCAKEQGYGHLLSEWNGFGGLLSGLLSGLDPAVKEDFAKKREACRSITGRQAAVLCSGVWVRMGAIAVM